MEENKQFEEEPPFAYCPFHPEVRPEDENFLQMLRLTFFPHFQLYSFTFFWLLTAIFVFVYSLSLAAPVDQSVGSQNEFLRVSQRALFILGENYPYYLVIKGNYYRLLTSTVLFRNLYHFVIGAIGIVTFGSYIEHLVGFKRIFLLAISTAVGGLIVRDIFETAATLESLTPVCGLLGFLLGYFLLRHRGKWRFHVKEQVHMVAAMALVLTLYLQMGFVYRNLSWLSMVAAFILGFIFYFCDPDDEKYEGKRPCAIFSLIAVISVATAALFFKTQPPLIAI